MQILRGSSGGRTTVLYHDYESSTGRVWRRAIYNNAWRDGWVANVTNSDLALAFTNGVFRNIKIHAPSVLLQNLILFSICRYEFDGSDSAITPLGESGSQWWNVINWGISNRCCQIAIQTYLNVPSKNSIIYRVQHDSHVGNWIKIV